jgi:type II secretory pathway component PulL
MVRSINFVRDRQRNLSRLEVQDRLVFKWALLATGIVAALVLITIGVRVFFLYQLRQVTAEQKKLREAITAKEEVERSFTVFSYKLKALTDLFGKRKEKQETLEYFSNLFNQDVVISQLSYTADTEELGFTMRAKNIFVMEQVMNTLNSAAVKTKYPRMEKKSLGRGSDGAYSMSLIIPLAEKSLEEIKAEAAAKEGTIAPGQEGEPLPAVDAQPDTGAVGI